jgi:hypothetical protein
MRRMCVCVYVYIVSISVYSVYKCVYYCDTVYSIQYTVYSIQYTVYSIQYTVLAYLKGLSGTHIHTHTHTHIHTHIHTHTHTHIPERAQWPFLTRMESRPDRAAGIGKKGSWCVSYQQSLIAYSHDLPLGKQYSVVSQYMVYNCVYYCMCIYMLHTCTLDALIPLRYPKSLHLQTPIC